MALPDPNQVRSWGGKLLVDREGQPIGSVTQVYTDDDTGLPEWATTRIGEASFFVPLKDAYESDGQIHVLVHRDDVAKAPLVLDRRHITPDEEARLYRHYGIPYSPERSRSGLPVGEGPVLSPFQKALATTRESATAAQRRLATDRATQMLAALDLLLVTLLWVVVRRRAGSRG